MLYKSEAEKLMQVFGGFDEKETRNDCLSIQIMAGIASKANKLTGRIINERDLSRLRDHGYEVIPEPFGVYDRTYTIMLPVKEKAVEIAQCPEKRTQPKRRVNLNTPRGLSVENDTYSIA